MTNATPAEVSAWLTNRLPDEWRSAGAPEITVDREEIVVLLTVAAPEITDQATAAAAVDGRIAGFREETRDRRISVALEDGWISPSYGIKHAAPVVSACAVGREATFITLLAPREPGAPALSLIREGDTLFIGGDRIVLGEEVKRG